MISAPRLRASEMSSLRRVGRERGAERKLVGRANANDIGIGGNRIDDDPVRIHTHRHDARAGRQESRAQRRITGILERDDSPPGCHESPSQHIECLLRAGGHENVLRPTDHGARDGDMPRDRLAEPIVALIALRAAEGRRPALEQADLLGGHSAKHLEREEPGIHQRRAEVHLAGALGLILRSLPPEADRRGDVRPQPDRIEPGRRPQQRQAIALSAGGRWGCDKDT